MILLAVAVEKELGFWRPRADVDLLVTGVGAVDAASATARALARRSYRAVVNAGIGGAFDGGATVGDGVAIAAEMMEFRLEDGRPIALPGGETIVERVDADSDLVSAMVQRGVAALHGITICAVTCTETTARRYAALGAQVESMEGFAVLRAAQLAGVPAIEVRGISNRAGDRDRSGWNFESGVRALERVLATLFDVLDARNAGATR